MSVLPDVLLSVTVLGNAALAIALATSIRSVFVRAGTILVDYYRQTA